MTAKERDDHQFHMERIHAAESAAAELSYDLEAAELAAWLVSLREHKVRVKAGLVYVGGMRSEMGSRAYQLNPAKFTDALYVAGCAVVMGG